ncbi:MAG: transposase, partial [Chloroflexi bacterium]|nr:transposase [Chloroflexota bacterium]
ARGEPENWIKALKNAVEADRLSDHRFWANAFRLLMHAAAYWLLDTLRRWFVQMVGDAACVERAKTNGQSLTKSNAETGVRFHRNTHWTTPGLKKPMISTYTYTNMTLAHSAASFSFTCILTSSSSLGAYLLACIVFSITLTSSNSVWHCYSCSSSTPSLITMQRCLINHRSHQYGRAVRSTLHGQPAEPLRSVVLEVSLDSHFIDVGHPKLAAPPVCHRYTDNLRTVSRA